MTATLKEMTLEEQVAALQAQINFLMGMQGRAISPARRLQNIRNECRSRYFGTWKEMRDGETEYGPSGKKYSDYDAIMEIVNKTAGLLFKYSRGKANDSVIISGLVQSEDDVKEYEAVCDAVCLNLRKQIDEYSRTIQEEAIWQRSVL